LFSFKITTATGDNPIAVYYYHYIMEPIEGDRARTGLSRNEIDEWEPADNKYIQLRGSPVSHSPLHLFALQV